MVRFGLLLILIAAAGVFVSAQAPAALRFDVASIRPSKSVATYPTVTGRGPGRYAFANASVADLIRDAYSVRVWAVVGGPEWARRERFDVVATSQGRSSSQHPLMLQALLAERFVLRVHRETRQLPVYELVKARSDGRLGPNLRVVHVDCAREPCPYDDGSLSFRATALEWSAAAGIIGAGLDRPVIDKTGLSGQFAIDLRWAPVAGSPDAAAPPEQVSLFTAVQEQLGLKLQPAVGPIEVLVIDSVERPTPD